MHLKIVLPKNAGTPVLANGPRRKGTSFHSGPGRPGSMGTFAVCLDLHRNTDQAGDPALWRPRGGSRRPRRRSERGADQFEKSRRVGLWIVHKDNYTGDCPVATAHDACPYAIATNRFIKVPEAAAVETCAQLFHCPGRTANGRCYGNHECCLLGRNFRQCLLQATHQALGNAVEPKTRIVVCGNPRG